MNIDGIVVGLVVVLHEGKICIEKMLSLWEMLSVFV